jgi:uncharacterized membrane protein YdfJ with MMPL/SSD domain
MSIPSAKRSSRRSNGDAGRASGWGPTRLAAIATRRPGRVLAVWGVVVVASLGLTGTLLGTGLTSESSLTNHPETDQAQKLIDARLPQENAIDEVIVVRSERLVTSDPAFAARVQALVAQARRSGAVKQISSYQDPGGAILVSADRHATLLPVVVTEPKDERILDLISTSPSSPRAT